MIAFLEAGGAKRIKLKLCTISVQESGKAGPQAWAAEDQDHQGCVTTGTVVYGLAPSTLVLTTAPAKLKAGTIYDVQSSGWSHRPPHTASYGGGRFIFHRGAWRSLPT